MNRNSIFEKVSISHLLHLAFLPSQGFVTRFGVSGVYGKRSQPRSSGVGNPTLLAVVVFLLVQLFGCNPCPAFACEWDAEIQERAEAAGVPWKVAVAICHAESGGNYKAIGSDGEIGLFQWSKKRWENCGACGDPHDPETNIHYAIEELAKCGKNRDPRVYVAWWNAGRMDYWNLKPKWSTRHPNLIYRKIYRGELN